MILVNFGARAVPTATDRADQRSGELRVLQGNAGTAAEMFRFHCASRERSAPPAVVDSASHSGCDRASGGFAGPPLPGRFELLPVAGRLTEDPRLSEISAGLPGRLRLPGPV